MRAWQHDAGQPYAALTRAIDPDAHARECAAPKGNRLVFGLPRTRQAQRQAALGAPCAACARRGLPNSIETLRHLRRWHPTHEGTQQREPSSGENERRNTRGRGKRLFRACARRLTKTSPQPHPLTRRAELPNAAPTTGGEPGRNGTNARARIGAPGRFQWPPRRCLATSVHMLTGANERRREAVAARKRGTAYAWSDVALQRAFICLPAPTSAAERP